MAFRGAVLVQMPLEVAGAEGAVAVEDLVVGYGRRRQGADQADGDPGDCLAPTGFIGQCSPEPIVFGRRVPIPGGLVASE